MADRSIAALAGEAKALRALHRRGEPLVHLAGLLERIAGGEPPR